MNPLLSPYQLIVDLPNPTDSDLIDTIRVLQSITNALIIQHDKKLKQQLRTHELQLQSFQDDEEELQNIPY